MSHPRLSLCRTVAFASALAIGAVAQLPFNYPVNPTLPDGFLYEPLVSGLDSPTCFGLLPDGRIIVGEQNSGALRLVVGTSLSTLFTLPDVNTNGFVRGLLSLAIDSSWPSAPYVYVFYTSTTGGDIRIVRLTASGDLSNPSSAALTLVDPYVVLEGIPDATDEHNGGSLRFDPQGRLFVSTGDDLDVCSAADITRLSGKILRLDVHSLPPGPGGPPPKAMIAAVGNPFMNAGDDAALVWSFGLRNPFRFGIDPSTSDLFIADVGSDTWEEIDHAPFGGCDFGWPRFEGPAATTIPCPIPGVGTLRPPIASIAHPFAIAVMAVGRYRTSSSRLYDFGAEYEGDVFFADILSGVLLRLRLGANGWDYAPDVDGQYSNFTWALGLYGIVDATFGGDGALYICRRQIGQIARIRPGPLYPGNGADVAVQLGVNGVTTIDPRGIYHATTGDVLSFGFVSPEGGLLGQPYACGVQFIQPGHPAAAITLPGQFVPSIWIDPMRAVFLVDSLTPFHPGVVLQANGQNYGFVSVPYGLGMDGAAVILQVVASAPLLPPVGAGFSDAVELRFY